MAKKKTLISVILILPHEYKLERHSEANSDIQKFTSYTSTVVNKTSKEEGHGFESSWLLGLVVVQYSLGRGKMP